MGLRGKVHNGVDLVDRHNVLDQLIILYIPFDKDEVGLAEASLEVPLCGTVVQDIQYYDTIRGVLVDKEIGDGRADEASPTCEEDVDRNVITR